MTEPLVYDLWPPKNPDIIQLYAMNTPNGIKVSAALEEMALPYEPHTINIMQGDQFTEEFKSINPNSKIPAIVDPNGPDGKPFAIMESGAILFYLGEKTGKLLPSDPVGKNECLQWLFFQVGHVGPMFGQFGHFYKFAVDKCKDPYPTQRYLDETRRLLGVLEDRLKDRSYILGEDYTIADIAIFPWVGCLDGFYAAGKELKMDEFVHVGRWLASCQQRSASTKAAKVCSLT